MVVYPVVDVKRIQRLRLEELAHQAVQVQMDELCKSQDHTPIVGKGVACRDFIPAPIMPLEGWDRMDDPWGNGR